MTRSATENPKISLLKFKDYQYEEKNEYKYRAGPTTIAFSLINELERYLETQAKESWDDWLEDDKLVSLLKNPSQLYFQKNWFPQRKLIDILQIYHLLPNFEEQNISSDEKVVFLWRQAKIFQQHSIFISALMISIINYSNNPYPLMQILLEIKEEKALIAVWCANSPLSSKNFLAEIINRIRKSSIDFEEAHSLITLLLQKGYLNFNDSQMQGYINIQLPEAITELCYLVEDNVTCYYAQSILALLKVGKDFNFPEMKIHDWQDKLFKKYKNTDQVECKIGLSDFAFMIPKLLDFPQIQSMMQYNKAAHLVIMASLQLFFPDVLILLVKSYLNPPPLEIKTAQQGQTFFTQKKQAKDSGSISTLSQHLSPKPL